MKLKALLRSAAIVVGVTAAFTLSQSGAYATATSDTIVDNIGKCLDAWDGSTANGARIDSYQCNGTAAQNWRYQFDVTKGTTSYYVIYNPSTGKCLEDRGYQTGDGATVDQWTCNGGNNQYWVWKSNSTLVNVANGECLDLYHDGTANDTTIDLWNCNNTNAQIWFQY